MLLFQSVTCFHTAYRVYIIDCMVCLPNLTPCNNSKRYTIICSTTSNLSIAGGQFLCTTTDIYIREVETVSKHSWNYSLGLGEWYYDKS